MTKILPALFAAAATVSFAAPVLAADPTILVVDFDKVFQDSAAAKNGTQQLRTKYDGQLAQKRTAFQTAAQAYNTQVESARAAAKPNTPIPPATQTALQQAAQRAQAAQNDLQGLQEEVNESAGYVRQQIIQRATPLAEQLRGERKANAVVAKEQVLAADPAADVTATLIQRLDASFSAPSITPPQQGAAAAPATGATTAPARPTQGR